MSLRHLSSRSARAGVATPANNDAPSIAHSIVFPNILLGDMVTPKPAFPFWIPKRSALYTQLVPFTSIWRCFPDGSSPSPRSQSATGTRAGSGRAVAHWDSLGFYFMGAMMVALCSLTGVRTGELLALRWQAVDFGARTLRIAESVFQGNPGGSPKDVADAPSSNTAKLPCTVLGHGIYLSVVRFSQ